MDYDIKKKLYRIEFVAETKDGEVFSESLALSSMRQIEQQVKHFYPDVKRVQSFTCDTMMCSMPIGEFFEGCTKTRIGE